MSNIIDFFVDIYNFIRYDIWRITENELSRTRRFFYRLVKTLILAVRGFITDNLNVRASALTYSILFAVVPLFALIIAIAKGFGVEKLIENALRSSFFGQTDMIPTIMGFVDRYLKTTQNGLFIGIGLAVLFWSVMNFFMQVERAFNSIWQVKKQRSITRQFTTYFSAILIIPVLIVFSSGISIYINTAIAHTFLYDVLSPVLRVGIKLIPYLINWLVFTILYLVMPNTRVKFINALIAGIVAGSAFQIFQFIYIHGQVYLSRYNVVYGSFAAVPLLLLWLQISCLIVLLGAEISYASQNIKNFDYDVDTKNISRRYKNFLTLFVTYVIVKRFEEQKPPQSSDQIANHYKLPIRTVNQIITELIDSNIVSEVISENSKNKTYQPALDINQLTITMLFNKLERHGAEHFLSNKNETLDLFWHKTLSIKQKSEEITEHVLIKDIQ